MNDQFEAFLRGETKQAFTLYHYLNLFYPYTVWPDFQEGGYVITFPDLPGCMTQCEKYSEIDHMANQARELWIETAYENDETIPMPFSSPVR